MKLVASIAVFAVYTLIACSSEPAPPTSDVSAIELGQPNNERHASKRTSEHAGGGKHT